MKKPWGKHSDADCRSTGCAEYARMSRRSAQRVSRRSFLVRAGLTVATFGIVPGWLQAAAASVAGTAARRRRTLVVIFQRGAMDGLNAVIPFTEPFYRKARPGIAIPAPSRAVAEGGAAADLDGRFALHPALATLKPWWDRRHFAVVHAAGLPVSTRSHFDAQDAMESGTPGRKGTADGWVNRHLAAHPDPAATVLRAVALAPFMPRAVRGEAPVLAIPSLDALRPGGTGGKAMAASFESLYAESADAFLHGAGRDLFEARRLAESVLGAPAPDPAAAGYPDGRLGRDLAQIARLVKADAGLEIAFAEVGGWDHHANEGGLQGQLANRLRDLGSALAAFASDLGDRLADTCVVTLSEFGRTVRENGNRGTDHGWGTALFALGGTVVGGKVHGRWPGLDPDALFEGRDLAVTTDFRSVLSAALTRHLGARDTKAAFPGDAPRPLSSLFA